MNHFWLTERFKEWGTREAIVWCGRSFDYDWLVKRVDAWRNELGEAGIRPGEVVALEGDYSPAVCGLLLALIENSNIVVPLTQAGQAHREEFLKIAQVERVLRFNSKEEWQIENQKAVVRHPILSQLKREKTAGLVLFSSGSTGKSKGIVHHVGRLLEKFKTRRQAWRTLAFLLLDHIGGLNTLFYTLANGGTLISVEGRGPEIICQAIERHRVELLPASPTFLNLLLISEEYKRFNLSSLKLITYGTEPMLQATLERLTALFPRIQFQQTYGLSELGILRSKSKESSSLWVKIGGEGFETKVVDGILWIRAESAMLGYLNAPNPFDKEGWFNTQDLVEVDGDYVRILGRESEIINVGGEKVYPQEVEGVLLQMENIRDVTVRGEGNPILGQVVTATVTLEGPEDLEPLRKRIQEFCQTKLARHKFPLRIEVTSEPEVSERFKKIRAAENSAP